MDHRLHAVAEEGMEGLRKEESTSFVHLFINIAIPPSLARFDGYDFLRVAKGLGTLKASCGVITLNIVGYF